MLTTDSSSQKRGAANTLEQRLAETSSVRLEHRSKRLRIRGLDPLARAATIFASRFAVSEREPDKEALAHLIVTISHRLKSCLLVVDLLVLGHVGFVAEVVKVPGIRLRVQLRDEGRPGLAQASPVDFCEVLVVVDVLNIGKAPGARVDASVEVTMSARVFIRAKC